MPTSADMKALVVVSEIERRLKKDIIYLKALYTNKAATILVGKYKGRLGKISHVMIDDTTVRFLVHPYSKRHPETLLLDDPEARTYHPLSAISIEED